MANEFDNDAMGSAIFDAEITEEKLARRYGSGLTGCYQHKYMDDGAGGGVCRCGDSVSEREL